VTNPQDIEFQESEEISSFEIAPSDEAVIDERFGAYTSAQRSALARYMRISMLRRDVLPLLEPTDWRTRLIHKALYSTYRDCEELGLGNEVRLLRERTVSATS
jgi:hypothetical protein